MTLGQKQSIPSLAAWQTAFEHADRLYPDPELDALVDRTVDQIRRETVGRRVAYGWSGGKDSLALEIVMGLAGVHECVLVISDLEYPAFLQWATDRMPDGLEIISTGQNLTWLRSHPEMLFPQGRYGPLWFKIVQHTGQEQYFRKRRLQLLALGRRRKDGNYVGRNGETKYTNARGITRWSPLADWPHEAVLALLKRHQIQLPPCYSWPRGFQVGTGSWPARQWTSPSPSDDTYGWREVWQIDQEIVRMAADAHIPGAADWLQQHADV